MEGKFVDRGEPVVKMVEREAGECLEEDSESGLECKIVLAISTRIKVEQFMAKAIGDVNNDSNNEGSWTHKLLKNFAEKFPEDTDSIRTLRRVTLMTSERIHMNPIMYESILDLSGDLLKIFYHSVDDLVAVERV
ncbi:MAG: hypothetical protein OXG37_04150 [Actinomycetia bacterium]|nr:hypothetical protein [Actinomycetes bacterium]